MVQNVTHLGSHAALKKRKKESKNAIILEDIKSIKIPYRNGNGQGNKFRRKLNSWSFYEFKTNPV
jgi:putative transposase